MKIAQKIVLIYLLNIGFLFCAMLKPYDGAHLNYIYIEFEWDQISANVADVGSLGPKYITSRQP